ncbi:MAG: baseplate J/gp47 family protein [Saprospiraceae bacterium]
MDCTQNTDLLKLIREGTSQAQRLLAALNPDYAQVNERTPAHLMVFARAYAQYLNYYDLTNSVQGDWKRFFSDDLSALLATAVIQDVEDYATRLQETFAFLNNLDNKNDVSGLSNHFGNLFRYLGTLAKQIDILKTALPKEIGLKVILRNLIQTQLAPAFERLIAYYKGGLNLTLLNDVVPVPEFWILGERVSTFSDAMSGQGFSNDWITTSATDWITYESTIAKDESIFGNGATPFIKINHAATHNLFTSIFDQFLKVYARLVADAKLALHETLTKWDNHEPHYTLFLAFLQLNEYARQETNTLTSRHLDFYYRDVLKLKEKPAVPGQAHLLLELAKHVDAHLLPAGTLFRAGKDNLGHDTFFASKRDFVANQAKVAELKTVYRHKNKPDDLLAEMDNRLFASSVANSEDGLGAPILAEDQSWHPFFNKTYLDGVLTGINMPKGTIGFAVASHYLLLTEGTRNITLDITIDTTTAPFNTNLGSHVSCFLTTAEGWIEKAPVHFKLNSSTNLQLQVNLDGNDAAVTRYDNALHGYHFDVVLPVMIIALRQDTNPYIYNLFQQTKITNIRLNVDVSGLKTLAVSNDFGPVDTSKPFLPFGSSPITNSSFIIGSKELFQKSCDAVDLNITWQVNGSIFTSPNNNTAGPSSTVFYLQYGEWISPETIAPFSTGTVKLPLTALKFNDAVKDVPDFNDNEPYSTTAANGFLKVALNNNFGQVGYQIALRDYLIAKAHNLDTVPDPGKGPDIPIALSMSIHYSATQQIPVHSSIENIFKIRKARFFHIGPFGEAEKHAFLNPLASHHVHLLPQFDFKRDGVLLESISEFYIGVTDLKPPQNLAFLFQVADGTADPLAQKPEPGEHIHWDYLRGNEWAPFTKDQVEDATRELTQSGIITIAVPREATSTNTILPAGKFWIRLAVSEKSEAVCKLLTVAAQGLFTTYDDQQNDPEFPAKTIASGTISKLKEPDAAIKKIVQPFDSSGGRGKETSNDFYRRVSERLRHKDRGVTLWDYEHLILEAFPKIYKVKCLNHTEYEPTENGLGTYRELAPGHVTIVTVPNQSQQNVRNPLRPYTSLGTLLEIESFLKKKLSCFIKLHVKNPQFEEIKTEFLVRFNEDVDETFYTKKLQEEITRFLSPWAFTDGGSPSFGGKIYKSVLINFIEERSYVDYIADFKLRHKPGGSQLFSKDTNQAEASTAISILVSVPAAFHLITPILTVDVESSTEKCPCES